VGDTATGAIEKHVAVEMEKCREVGKGKHAPNKGDGEFVVEDLAFYLPGRFERTQPGEFGRGTKRR